MRDRERDRDGRTGGCGGVKDTGPVYVRDDQDESSYVLTANNVCARMQEQDVYSGKSLGCQEFWFKSTKSHLWLAGFNTKHCNRPLELRNSPVKTHVELKSVTVLKRPVTMLYYTNCNISLSSSN